MIFALAAALRPRRALALHALGASTRRVALVARRLLGGHRACSGPFLMTRFDLFAAARHAAARSARSCTADAGSGPCCSALAIATKIYPAVLLPLARQPCACARRGGRRRSARSRSRLGTVVLVYLPFLVARAGRGGHEALAAGRAAAPDREPRRLGPARPPPRLRDAARLGVRLRLAEPDRDRRVRSRRASRRCSARPRSCSSGCGSPAGTRRATRVRALRGRRGRGVRRLRQGRLAAVPRLAPRRRRARPRPSRRRSRWPARRPPAG